MAYRTTRVMAEKPSNDDVSSDGDRRDDEKAKREEDPPIEAREGRHSSSLPRDVESDLADALGYGGDVLTEATVNAIVIYESLTGNTKKAAGFIVDELIANGVAAVSCPTTDVDYQALADADFVIVGSWTDGLFLFGQKPANAGRLSQIPFLTGKRAAVYCTYALETGKTLEKLEGIVKDRGAEVIGGMAIRRNKLQEGSAEFVSRLLGVVSV